MVSNAFHFITFYSFAIFKKIKKLSATVLIIGSMSPDFEYFLE
jgi:hypothetical protein